jgi:hemerythrin superfamily protein
LRHGAGTGLARARVQRGNRRAQHETGRTMTSDHSPLGNDDEDLDGNTDAIALLTADHEEVRQLFEDYDELVADGAADTLRGDLAQEICDALTAHATIEEELFYPAVREALGDDDLIDTALADHAGAKELIARIEAMEPADDLFDATVRMLEEAVEHHVEEEEADLFPQVEDSEIDLLALGEQLLTRKEEVLAELEDNAG